MEFWFIWCACSGLTNVWSHVVLILFDCSTVVAVHTQPNNCVFPVVGTSASAESPGAAGDSGSVFNSKWPAEHGSQWQGGNGSEYGGGGGGGYFGGGGGGTVPGQGGGGGGGSSYVYVSAMSTNMWDYFSSLNSFDWVCHSL